MNNKYQIVDEKRKNQTTLSQNYFTFKDLKKTKWLQSDEQMNPNLVSLIC